MEFIIDGTAFTAGAITLRRQWEVEETYRVTTEDGIRHRRIRGVYPVYSLVLGNIDKDTYDRLTAQLTSKAASQTVRLPDGKEGFVTYDAMFTGIADELITERNGVRHWDNLTVTFASRIPMEGVEGT